MRNEFTTFDDARRLVHEWVENYVDWNEITEEQLDRATRALVDHVGGYGVIFDVDGDNSYPNTRDFDLDFHIYGRK